MSLFRFDFQLIIKFFNKVFTHIFFYFQFFFHKTMFTIRIIQSDTDELFRLKLNRTHITNIIKSISV